MRKDKTQAFESRKFGRSYNEIRAKLGVPKSTLSGWLKDADWSEKIKSTLIEKSKKYSSIRMRKLTAIRGKHLEQAYKEARNEAKEEFEYLKLYPLFIAGLTIYWGEGDKLNKHFVRIANVDPIMIRSFVNFLLKVCSIPKNKVRASILIYPDLEAISCVDYWSKKSGLPKQNFIKCITIKGRHKTKKLEHGVCNIYISSTYFKEKMLVWLSLLSKELSKRYYADIKIN